MEITITLRLHNVINNVRRPLQHDVNDGRTFLLYQTFRRDLLRRNFVRRVRFPYTTYFIRGRRINEINRNDYRIHVLRLTNNFLFHFIRLRRRFLPHLTTMRLYARLFRRQRLTTFTTFRRLRSRRPLSTTRNPRDGTRNDNNLTLTVAMV